MVSSWPAPGIEMGGWDWGPSPSISAPFSSVTLTNSQKTSITGTKLEDDFAGATIGKDIPVFIGGQMLAGCKLIEGPFLLSDAGEGFVDYVVGPFVVAVPSADRDLESIRLNGTESFTSADGGATWTSTGTVFDDVVINVLYGTETQTSLASSIDRYGTRAVPYRSHVCIELKDVPLAPFANFIPFVSVYLNQDDYLTRREALTRILRYVRFDDSEFETEVSGQDTFWVKIGQESLFDFLQTLLMSIGRNWNVVATDKLRIFENSATVTPVSLTSDDVVVDSVRFWTDAPEGVPAIRELGFVDTDGDNDFNVVKAVRARFPIPLTSSQDSQQLDLPIGMSRAQAKIIANKSLLSDEFARDKMSCKLLPHMRGILPGDIIAQDFDPDIAWENGRVISLARNPDWTSDIVVERVEVALFATGPSITSNGGGSTASITIDEDTTAVTTVTADQSGTFSISGGDDSSFFTIHPTTGVLTITARDFESPADSDANNTYQVIVQILSDGLTGTQIITVTVSNVLEAGETAGSPIGLLLTLTYD